MIDWIDTRSCSTPWLCNHQGVEPHVEAPCLNCCHGVNTFDNHIHSHKRNHRKKTKVLYASPLREATKGNVVKFYKLPHDPWPQQTPTIIYLLWSCTFNQIESHKALQLPQDLLQLPNFATIINLLWQLMMQICRKSNPLQRNTTINVPSHK